MIYTICYIISLRNVPFAYHICFCFHFISLILCLTFDFLSTGCSFLFLSQIHSNVNYYHYIFLEKEKWNYLRKLKKDYLYLSIYEEVDPSIQGKDLEKQLGHFFFPSFLSLSSWSGSFRTHMLFQVWQFF